ncbi:MAG: hypothetical protein HC888_16000 [Candidatus Competibacteraceae bacterium]|nr:hypothetical protein [Candidatus Competibacteraceae bacterium]
MSNAVSSAAFSADIVRLPFANSRLLVVEPDYSWRSDTIARLEDWYVCR